MESIDSCTAVQTYTWGLRYIDDLVCRDKGNERLYSIADPNWNVVAICNTSGVVQERIMYNSFGKANWLDAGFVTKTASSYAWNRTFTGQVWDAETGLMLYRNRFYHSGLGRFVTRDPIGYEGDGVNLYRAVQNQPVKHTDKDGLYVPNPLQVYGNYCGASLYGQNGPPLDDLDKACAEHDECLATYKEFLIPFRRYYCDRKLCAQARLTVACGDCRGAYCIFAALAISNVMCTVGTIPIPLPEPYVF